MKAITRRKFMGLVAGGLVGTVFASKGLISEVKIKREIINEEDIHLIKASEIVSDGLKASNIKVETISRMEYNVVDDLVEEEKVSNILFNTVKRGKTTFAELAYMLKPIEPKLNKSHRLSKGLIGFELFDKGKPQETK